jgi:hypothetical protein
LELSGAVGAVVSTVNGTEVAGLVLPAASVATTESGPPVAVPEHEYPPPAVAVVMQTTELSGFLIVTVEFASALPEIVTAPDVGFGEAVPVGAVGATLSNVSSNEVEGLIFPTPSVAVALNGPPFAVPEQENDPSPAAFVLQIVVPSGFLIVTVEPGSTAPATPVIVTGPLLGFGETVIFDPSGAVGAEVSTVNGTEVTGLVLPAPSVAVAVRGPPVAVPAQEYVPPTEAFVVHTVVPSGFFTTTVLPASALPETVTAPEVGFGDAVPVGAEGAMLSNVKGIEPGVLVFPTLSVAVALKGPPFAVPAQENDPSPAAVVVQMTELSGFLIVTVEPASALPEIVTGPFDGFGDAVPVGADGAVVSIITGTEVAGLTLLALSVAVTDRGALTAVPEHE